LRRRTCLKADGMAQVLGDNRRDGRGDARGLGHRREGDVTEAVAELAGDALPRLHRQSRLAHAPRPQQGQQPAARVAQPGHQPRQILLPPRQGKERGRQVRRAGLSSRRGRRPLPDKLVELCRRRLGLHAQLGGQGAFASLVLGQRRRPLPVLGQEPHQRPLRRLIPGISRRPMSGIFQRQFGLPALLMRRRQLPQRLQVAAPQPLAHQRYPFVVGRAVLRAQLCHKVTAVKRDCSLQAVQALLAAQQRLELGHIDLAVAGGEEADRVAGHFEERRGRIAAKGGTHSGQSLSQVGARRSIVLLRPQQRGQRGAAMRPAGLDGQVGQQRTSLFARERAYWLVAQRGLEATKQGQLESRHRPPPRGEGGSGIVSLGLRDPAISIG